MVVGSDRVKEFSVLLNRYNDAPDKKGNQLFKFDSVEVISAGERDPDSEGVEGMSASKMRFAAADGNFDSFSQGLPSGFKDAKNIYRDVRKYMGIREERDMGDMTDFETIRDAYLTGKFWNVGDLIEANGVSGEVVRKGTNYLSFADENGKVHKAWLHEIELEETLSGDVKKWFAKKGLKGIKVRTVSGKNPFMQVSRGSNDKIPNDIIKKAITLQYDKVPSTISDPDNIDYGNFNSRMFSLSLDKMAELVKEDVELDEGTWLLPRGVHLKGLKKLLTKPLELGKNGENAMDALDNFIGDDEFHHHLWAMLLRQKIRVRLHFCTPLDGEGMDRKQLCAQAYERLEGQLKVQS